MRRGWNKEGIWHYFSFASNGHLDMQAGDEKNLPSLIYEHSDVTVYF